MPRKTEPAQDAETDAERGARGGPTIKDLLSYRIHRLANALSQGAARRYRAEHGVSLMEWRVIALLGDFAPMTLKDLARQSGLDKSLASRAVSGLVARGLVARGTGEADAREVSLRLSPEGARVCDGLMRSALARDAAFLGALGEAERAALDRAIETLTAVARAQAEPRAWEAPRPGTANPKAADPGTATPRTANPRTANPRTANPGTARPARRRVPAGEA